LQVTNTTTLQLYDNSCRSQTQQHYSYMTTAAGHKHNNITVIWQQLQVTNTFNNITVIWQQLQVTNTFNNITVIWQQLQVTNTTTLQLYDNSCRSQTQQHYSYMTTAL
jgi:hypothetical protein